MKRDTPWFQRDRYYTFERDGKFCVSYAFRGTNCFQNKEFDTAEELQKFVDELPKTFQYFRQD